MKLINKLRANYNLANVLIRILFVLAYVLYSWQTSLSVAALMLGQWTGVSNYSVWLSIMTSAVLGVIIMLLLPLVTNVFLHYSRFYTVPRAEYSLIAMLFFALYFAVCGALKLINLATPILLIWGEVIFPVVVSLGCVIWFYHVTSNLYFNNQTKPFYFRNLATTYAILIIVAEVLL